MTVETTNLKGLVIVRLDKHEDLRGSFIKPFNSESFAQLGLVNEFKEYYYSQSHKNVIRGMHFQRQPFQYTKLIFVNHGTILDVILDVRPDSDTYADFIELELSAADPLAILIPPGFAHGYLSLSNDSTVSYLQTSVYNAAADTGVRFDSFDFNWPCAKPIVSERDLSLPMFEKNRTRMKILMTGSTGYVGSHLLPKLLDRGHDVLTLVRPGRNHERSIGAQILEIPSNQKVLQQEIHRFRPEICLHLASHLTAADDYDTLETLLSSNIQFTCRILDALKAFPPKLFINTGTFAEYYCGNEELDPAYLYAATKTAARSFVRYYASSYHFKAATVVPFTIYGGTTEQRKIIDLISDSLGATKPTELTPGEQVLDFIHIEDVVAFYTLLVEQYETVSDDINFYLGTGRGHNLRQLTEMMEEMTGQRANINWGGRPYRERDTFYSVANISQQYRMWKWKPKICLKDGLCKYFNEREYAA